MPEGNVKVIVEGAEDSISVCDFLSVLSATINLLSAIEVEPEWTIGEISHASPANVEFVSSSLKAPWSISVMLDGLATLERGDSRPPGFSDKALKRAKKLTSKLGKGLASLTYVSSNKTVRISQRIAASVDAIVHAPTYSLYTEIEGVLGQVKSYAGINELLVYDPLTDDATLCKFNSDDDAQKLGALITKRVRVYGEARYSRDDEPKQITVEFWEAIAHDIPKLSELHREKINLTNGERSEEVIRRLRDLDV